MGYPSLHSLCVEYGTKYYYVKNNFYVFYTKLSGWCIQYHWYEYDKKENRFIQIDTTTKKNGIKRIMYKKEDDPHYFK